jgi:serine/threonine-protein kinase
MPGGPAQPDVQPWGGIALADYDVLAAAGRGAFSTVYRARDRRSGRVVALKILHAAPEAGSAAAPADEAALAAHLRHPHIVQTIATGSDSGRRWIALEWVPGRDLRHYVDQRWRLPDPLVVQIGQALADALGHAHRHGVTHRDVKPANVRVNLPQRIVKLGDFGISSLHDGTATATGVMRGTPAYMAPELLHGGVAGAASDVYALGVVLYELLTGRRPHEADNLGQLLSRIARDRPPALSDLRPDLPAALDELLGRLLQPEPAARPADVAALVRELAAIGQSLDPR